MRPAINSAPSCWYRSWVALSAELPLQTDFKWVTAVPMTLPRTLSCLLLLLTASGPAAAQQFVCRHVRPGDTATHIALRWTGDAQSRHHAWFQIVDPAQRRVISKARYDLILPGWQVCLATPLASTRAAPVRIYAVGASSTMPTSQFATRLAAVNHAHVGWALLCFTLILLLAWPLVETHLRARRALMDRMKRFGDRFIDEFERPLVRPDAAARPIKSRMRFIPDRERLDILLAPGDGRTYPNLSDHRRNVEYDVERIVQHLGEPFISGQLRTQGHWVAIPFQLTADTKKAGVV